MGPCRREGRGWTACTGAQRSSPRASSPAQAYECGCLSVHLSFHILILSIAAPG